eukprot:2441763-Prymnesium_polylepis.1
MGLREGFGGRAPSWVLDALVGRWMGFGRIVSDRRPSSLLHACAWCAAAEDGALLLAPSRSPVLAGCARVGRRTCGMRHLSGGRA